MAIASLSFLGFVVVAIILAGLSDAPRYRSAVLLLVNLAFIASFAGSPLAAAPLALFVALGYLFLRILGARADFRLLAVFIVLIVALFVYLKRYSAIGFAPSLPFPYIEIGLSYILFRVIHLLVDIRDGVIAEPVAPLAFFNYVCFFANFVAGPIQRYPDFVAQIGHPARARLDGGETFLVFNRVVNGFIKIVVVSTLFLALHERALAALAARDATGAVLAYGAAATAFYLHFYYNFAGYMDVVIGVARMLGIDLPENFNRPFRARNFLDFWTRWHITLAEWFRDYLFNPLVKWAMHRLDNRALVNAIGVAAFFVTFLVMGLWHGTTGIFLLYGLFLGFGVSLNKLYQVAMTARLGRGRYASLGRNPIYAYACRGLTFGYIAIALTCIWADRGEFARLASALGPAGLVSALVSSGLAGAAAMVVWDRVAALAEGFAATRSAWFEGFWVDNLWLAGKTLFVVSVALLLARPVPEIVYKAF